MKKIKFLGLFAVVLFILSGCATGRNYQSDIDSLNSRVSALQGQLSAKDQEIAGLQSQLNSQQSVLAQAEADKRVLSEKLDSALANLQSKSLETVTAKTVSERYDSDLK